MDKLWLLEGSPDAPGWGPLERDARAKKTDVLLFDRGGWALLRAPEAPAYDGLPATVPRDGLYLDDQGRGVYVVAARLVNGPAEVLATLGPEAQELLEKLRDPDVVLERLGRVY